MEQLRDGYDVIAQALGVDQTVLRAVVDEWAIDPAKDPMKWIDFEERLSDAQSIAQRLNNTNLWEHIIRESLDPTDIPVTLPTQGVLRLVPKRDGDE